MLLEKAGLEAVNLFNILQREPVLTINDSAEFTWSFGNQFFLETKYGNYIWNDPEYGGDNIISKFEGGIFDWYRSRGIPFGRAKGHHIIKEYCGKAVIIKK